MTNLRITEDALNLREVAKEIEGSNSFAVLLQNWKSFARELHLEEPDILDLESKINRESLQRRELPREILRIWVAAKGSCATQMSLVMALKDCKLCDIAEKLETKFGNVKLWETIQFRIQKNIRTLDKLVESNVLLQVRQKFKDDLFREQFLHQPISLFRQEPPPMKKLEYYISRKFLYRTKLKEDIFQAKSTKDHVFVVQGIEKVDLARVVRPLAVESSQKQKHRVTGKIIKLDRVEHFSRICENSKKPVHLLEYKDNLVNLYWVKSTKELAVVQDFLTDECQKFDEQDAVHRIINNGPPFALSIADSPGMGKTSVLANLARKVSSRTSHLNAITLFIEFPDIIQNIKSSDSALEAISNYSCENNVTRFVFNEMLKNLQYLYHIFLDGYDEVKSNDLDIADSFLNELNKMQNIKIILTTRPHFKSRLENICNNLSFQIEGFYRSSQIEFLCKYWVKEHGAMDSTTLKAFAEKCLDTLDKEMTDKEKIIAGIPLQCMMLAEVYSSDAKENSELNDLPDDAVERTSFSKMYKKLIEKKFERIFSENASCSTKKELRQLYTEAHVCDAIALLFQEWSEIFKEILLSRDAVDENLMYSIGLKEKSAYTNAPKFVHRTFAEYLIAQFLAEKVSEQSICLEFLFKEILGEKGVIKHERHNRPATYELKHPVIAYFANKHLEDIFNESNSKSVLISKYTAYPPNILVEDVCLALAACCSNDLEAIFEIAAVVFHCMKNKSLVINFSHLVHLAVENTEIPEFVEVVQKFTSSKCKTNKDYDAFGGTYSFENGLKIPKCTPLHVAIYQGKSSIAIKLLELYGKGAHDLKHLTHVAVYKSAENNEKVIEDKLIIIQRLHDGNKKLLEDSLEGRLPLLQDSAHIKIIKFLVELKAEINTYSEIHGTVLHTAGNKNSYTHVVRWALSEGFEAVHKCDNTGRNCLAAAIQRFGRVDDEVLELFSNAATDFSAHDNNQNSVLFYAIIYSKDVCFVQKLIDYGADINHLNRIKETAAHLVLKHFQNDEKTTLTLLTVLKEKGFRNFAQKNDEGHTTLHLYCALKYQHDIGVSEDDSEYNTELIRNSIVEDKILQLILEEWVVRDLPIPKPSDYYISRTFVRRSFVNEDIFKDDSAKHHIFVVKGIVLRDLAKFSGFKAIERSGNQLEGLTVQIILLELDEDFDRICKITLKPVHLLYYKDGTFAWVKSTGGMDVLRRFITDQSESFTENEVLEMIIATPSPFQLCISDSAGMGKTSVLQDLAYQTRLREPDSMVVFVTLVDFFLSIESSYPTLDAISNYLCTNKVMRFILNKLLENPQISVYLFLDGFDEIMRENLDMITSFLLRMTETANIKIILTTRPHRQAGVEDIFRRFSFQILPFTLSDQISFLIRYWTSKYEARVGETLHEFARKCLEQFAMNVAEKERDISGIQLHCMMLAEVYAEDARRASELKELPEDAVKIISYFQIYKALIAAKFSRISDSRAHQKYLDAHIYDSIAILFPEWLEKFEPYLTSCGNIDENILYSIGLLEKAPLSDVRRFVHRTFAEYLLADFLVRSLQRSNIFVDFIFKQILGEMGVTADEEAEYQNAPYPQIVYKLKYPVIAYFINMHLADSSRNDRNLFEVTMDLKNITEEDICVAANVCCCNDLESCFELTARIMSQLRFGNKVELQEKYIKHLPKLVVKNTDNVSLLKRVLNFTKLEFKANLSYHVQTDYLLDAGLIIPHCTPHLAVYLGKYNMVMYLLQEYKEDVHSLKYLLHTCVYNSAVDSESKIEGKLLIVEALTQVNREWLEEDYGGRAPILQFNVHVRILQHLVRLGANINAQSAQYGTVLHTAGDQNSFLDLVGWALDNGFCLINHKDCDGLTPLVRAIKRFGTLDEEVLQLLGDAGADVNHEDDQGNSVLFYAIKHQTNIDFIKKIIDHGGNPNHINCGGQNAGHIVILNFDKYSSEHNTKMALQLLQLLESRGYDGFNLKNLNGDTPLELAITSNILDEGVLEFLRKKTTNTNKSFVQT